MDEKQPIRRDFFAKRVADLCLRSGMTGFPKDAQDQHILLKSIILTMDRTRDLTEKEVNQKIETWMADISQIKKLDHSTLRRWLIDTGYLTRTPDGSVYHVATPGTQAFSYEESIEQLNLYEVIEAARIEAERRKQEYMEKARAKQA